MASLGGQILVGGIGMLALGVALLVSLRLMQGQEEADRPNTLRLVQQVVAWMLLSMGLFGMFEAGFTLVQLLFLFVAVIIVLPLALNRFFMSQRQTLLTLLAIATQQQQPLAPVVAAFSGESGWFLEGNLLRLAGCLQAGQSLSQAVRSTAHWVLPHRARMLIDLGDHTGRLAPALAEAARNRELEGVSGKWVTYFTYLIFLMLIGASVLIFMMIQIVPAFKAIFEDFNLALPPMTQVLIDASTIASVYWFLFVPLLMFLLALFLYAVGRYTGWVEVDLPLIGQLFRRFDTATILRGLALVVEAERPLADGVAIMGREYPRRWIRQRLAEVWGEVTLGVDWRQSLSTHGLMSAADEGLLRSAEQAGNLAWAMRITADNAERRLAYRLQALLEFASPLVLLCISVAVAYFVIALFVPLVTVIESMV